MSILDFVPPSYTLRDNQPEILQEIENNWSLYDIFVLVSDVGTGKSVILQTIARWQEAQKQKVATITPQVMLQDQYSSQFPGVPVLKGSARYECKSEPGLSCKDYKAGEKFYCKGCVYKCKKKEVIESGNAIFNLHSYLLAKNFREVILIDEAHTLLSQLSDLYTVNVWKHLYNYPDTFDHYGDILLWIESTRAIISQETDNKISTMGRYTKEGMSPSAQKYKETLRETLDLQEMDKKLENIFQGIEIQNKGFFVEHTKEYYRNKKVDLLRLRPRTLQGMPINLFSKTVKKMVLATATLHQLDLIKLGLGDKRVKFLEFDSPLLASDRPIIPEFVGNMSFRYQEKNMDKLISKILSLRKRHITTKGIVHCTYRMAETLQEALPAEGFIFHTTLDKDAKLEEFKAAPPGTVLIGSGMSMGIDLAGPEFGWQAITKIMYPNKGDVLVAEWYAKEPNWITWLATKDLIQACGRVNRYKGDKAITYILDSCFGNPSRQLPGLYQKAARAGLLPKYFKSRIKW